MIWTSRCNECKKENEMKYPTSSWVKNLRRGLPPAISRGSFSPFNCSTLVGRFFTSQAQDTVPFKGKKTSDV